MISRCCVCVCVCVCVRARARACMCVRLCIPLIVARQRLNRNVTAVTNTHTTEELLDALFSMWPMSYQGKCIPPPSLIGNGSVKIPLSLPGNGSVETLPR
jgi:hypothetical protein